MSEAHTIHMKVALYARVSTRDKGQDTENQLAQLRDYCQQSHWTVVHEYVDHLSGKTAKRPQFAAMFEAAQRREFNLVLFWALDRFSREGTLPTLKHLEVLEAACVGYRSFTEQWLDSAGMFKDVVISIMSTLAKIERLRIVERINAGLATARTKRKHDKTLPPFGRPRAVVDQARITELQDRGLSVRAIAERLHVSKSTISRRSA
jgi:DNA invertase Pin-like site-specific DNA recombinase